MMNGLRNFIEAPPHVNGVVLPSVSQVGLFYQDRPSVYELHRVRTRRGYRCRWCGELWHQPHVEGCRRVE